MISPKATSTHRRKLRVRRSLKQGLLRDGASKLRLSVHRSNRQLYAQIIDDVNGRTLVSASTLDKKHFPAGGVNTSRTSALKLGEWIAELALKKDISAVVFDRGQFLYHGRVKALAEGARSKGLKF